MFFGFFVGLLAIHSVNCSGLSASSLSWNVFLSLLHRIEFVMKCIIDSLESYWSCVVWRTKFGLASLGWQDESRNAHRWTHSHGFNDSWFCPKGVQHLNLHGGCWWAGVFNLRDDGWTSIDSASILPTFFESCHRNLAQVGLQNQSMSGVLHESWLESDSWVTHNVCC